MTPRQARIGVDVYTGAVIVSVAVALAGLTWRLTGDAGDSPAAAPVVARRDSNDITNLITLAPFGTVMAEQAAGGGDGAIKLKAIFMSVPAESSVVLIAGSDGKVVSYGIGAAVGGGVIESIQAEQIVLRTASGPKTVALFPATGPVTVAVVGGSTTAPVIVVPAAVPTVVTVAPGAGVPASAALPPASPSAPSSTPSSTGFRIGPSLSPQLLSTGLQAGDVIERVNGTPVSSGTNEREIFARAKAAGVAEIVLTRGGRQVTLSVPIP